MAMPSRLCASVLSTYIVALSMSLLRDSSARLEIAGRRDDWSRAYFLKKSARHSLGDAPKRVRNDLLKCDRSLNPQLKAISEMPQLFC
jgi:hypothetical protein